MKFGNAAIQNAIYSHTLKQLRLSAGGVVSEWEWCGGGGVVEFEYL